MRKAEAVARGRRGTGESDFGDPPGPFTVRGIPAQRQVAERLIDEAGQARHHRQARVFERCRDLLVVGVGGPGGLQVVDQALFTSLLREVEKAWGRGWQPAEIVRAMRRELSPRHGSLVIDVIAGQMRNYSGASVEPRWRAQLDALGAGVWWERDDRFALLWGERHGVDRSESVVAMLDVLVELLRRIDRTIAEALRDPGPGFPVSASTTVPLSVAPPAAHAGRLVIYGGWELRFRNRLQVTSGRGCGAGAGC